jgi:hypothetical protein
VKNSRRDSLDSGNRQVVVAVAECLMAISIDQIATYEKLSRVAGCDVRQSNRWIVLQALELLNREHGVVYACERGTGYRRLSSESGVKHAGEKGLNRSRNAARNARRQLENAVHHANDLTPAEQRTANQRLAVLGLVEHLTKAKVVKTMPDEPKNPKNDLTGLKAALGI